MTPWRVSQVNGCCCRASPTGDPRATGPNRVQLPPAVCAPPPPPRRLPRRHQRTTSPRPDRVPLAENGLVNTGPGRAIFLVGPSSAGKSSLGKALVELLPDPFMFFETDRCGLRGPARPELETLEREEVLTRGVAFAIRGYLEAGVDLVVEVGLWHRGPGTWRQRSSSPSTPGLSVCGGILRNWSVGSVNETTESSRAPPVLKRLAVTLGASHTTSLLMPSGSPRPGPRRRSSTGSRPARYLAGTDGWLAH